MGADEPIKIRCYVDGLNLYNSLIRHHQVKWIDFEKLLRNLITSLLKGEKFEIERIILFTALVKGNQESHSRQKLYLLALAAHLARLEIVYGEIVPRERIVTISKGIFKGRRMYAKTYIEKKTDVNLASRMIEDAYEAKIQGAGEREFDVACLLSNDSGLESALRITSRAGQRNLLICPITKDGTSRVAKSLTKYVSTADRLTNGIDAGVLRDSLLPAVVKVPGKNAIRPPNERGWEV